jgi:hypothetical protein
MKISILLLALTLPAAASANTPFRAPAPVVHFEFAVKNLATAEAFYSDLFGWTYESAPIPGYAYITSGEGGIGGGFRLEPGADVSGFQGSTVYVLVDCLKETLAHAMKLGSTMLVPPIVVSPEIGSIAVITDLDGNVIGLFSKESHQ